MTIKIGSNIASLQAQRRLGDATASLSHIYESLSSGQRINRASDDAAGLAIADDLNAKGRVFTQAIRNGNDGISVLNIADSAVEALGVVVTRIRELAQQSANGSYSNKQREALDSEAQALAKEYFRIAQTTTFNGIKVFDGSLGDGLRLQMGFGLEGSINASVGGAIGTGSVGDATSFSTESSASYAVALGDLNGDGILDLLSAGTDGVHGWATVRLGTGNGSFGNATSFSTESTRSNALQLGDLNGDGILDLVSAGYGGSHGWATVRLGTGNGNFGNATSFSTESSGSSALQLGDLNGDGILDLVTAGNGPSGGVATVRLGSGDGSFGSATSFTTETFGSYALQLGDLNSDGILDLVSAGGGYATVRLGTGDGSFSPATSMSAEGFFQSFLQLGDLNGDGNLDLVTTGDASGTASVRLGTGNGSFGSAASFSTGISTSFALQLDDLNGDGILDLVTAGNGGGVGRATLRLGSGDGSFGSATSIATESTNSSALQLGDLNGDGVLDLVSAGVGTGGKATIRLGSTESGLAPLLKFSIKTKADALQAMGPMQQAQDNLVKQRGVIGAYQSRISIALDNLASSKENFSAAESRIRDADVAQESANLIRTQILQQAASAVLAQANQAPALALTLLK